MTLPPADRCGQHLPAPHGHTAVPTTPSPNATTSPTSSAGLGCTAAANRASRASSSAPPHLRICRRGRLRLRRDRRPLLPHAEPFAFTLPSKSRLGHNLPAFAGTGRLKLYQPADDEQARHRGRLLRELETARYELKDMELLSFSVPAREGHDDYLMSLALCAYAAATTPPPPASQVIPPEEEYRPHTGEDWARVW